MKKIVLLLLTAVLLMVCAVPAFAQEDSYVVDDADLLTSKQVRDLEAKLEDIYAQHDFAVYIVTVDQHYGDIEDYTQQLYNELCGAGNDGIILVLSMEYRDYHLWTDGRLNDAISNSEMDGIEDAMLEQLGKDCYFEGFTVLADGCVDAVAFNWGMNLLIAAGIGLLVALIVVLVMRSQLKSVRRQNAAQNYVEPGSMNITRAHEFYLYRTVSRVRRVENSSGGRSSGGNHSRGGKF